MDNLVTIIMPLYNCKDYINDSIESVIHQTYQNWELIVIDDNSSDNSAEIVQNIQKKDKRIQLIKLKTNGGPARARNIGIKESKGRYLAFLDSDDIWHRDKLKIQIEFMKKKDVSFTFTSFKRIYYNGKTRQFNVPNQVTYRSILKKNIICNSSVIIDTKTLGKVFYPDIRKRQDYGLWLYLLKNKLNYGYGIDQVLTFRNVRPRSVSSNKLGLVKYNWILYRKILKQSVLVSLILLIKDICIKILKIK